MSSDESASSVYEWQLKIYQGIFSPPAQYLFSGIKITNVVDAHYKLSETLTKVNIEKLLDELICVPVRYTKILLFKMFVESYKGLRTFGPLHLINLLKC